MPSPNFRTLDLNLLRVFDAVMAEGSLTRAAEQLAMTQPAVSNAMKRLKASLGEELLIRTARGVKPTGFAQAAWPEVRAALSQLRSTLAPEAFDPHDASASFRIAAGDAGASLLMPAWRSASRRSDRRRRCTSFRSSRTTRGNCCSKGRRTSRWGISRRSCRHWAAERRCRSGISACRTANTSA
jgi:DNA-binding transcriptional LysR family regulator